MIDPIYRREILESALQARIREVTEYQVNIDNFRMAKEACAGEVSLAEFREQLTELLLSSIREQRKAKIMLGVIRKQLEDEHVG